MPSAKKIARSGSDESTSKWKHARGFVPMASSTGRPLLLGKPTQYQIKGMMRSLTSVLCLSTALVATFNEGEAFSTSQRLGSSVGLPTPPTVLAAREEASPDATPDAFGMARKFASLAITGLLLTTSPVYADEIGRETEAPTLMTGETVEICVKRGPLGACQKTERRTVENDNDKAEKYFRQPTTVVKMKEETDGEGNALIERLKQQSEDNREKNDMIVKQRTFLNDSSASFGPFDGQVLIMNADGQGFTLLENPQAMRLKKAGFIEGKKFVKQPTQKEIDDALEPDGPNLLQSILGN